MPDIIQLLPDSIANQIAAGEVIQRPASVVKELMENAIDAGASEINLIIKDAGKTLIQVIDNGSGMSETDARLSFERHATSKIRLAKDLFSIRTKGFRGEALASIAAIAQVEMITKLKDEDLGNRLFIEGSEVKKQEFCQASPGTKISVKNLFYNVPARRKFLKTDTVELKHLSDEFIRIATSHENVKFTLHHNEREMYHLPAGKIMQRITGIWGKKFAGSLVPVEENTDIVNIGGYVGKPEIAKRSRNNQFLFVNNRFIKSNYLNHAIKLAYENIIPADNFPVFFIFLEIDPNRIDINIHPTKQEIKFEEERLIYNYLRVSVKQALGKYTVTPMLDFDKDLSVDQLLNKKSEGRDFISGFDRSSFRKEKQDWQQVFEALSDTPGSRNDAGDIGKQSRIDFASTLDQENYGHEAMNKTADFKSRLIQVHGSYIICQIKSGMIILDQKNAHERILYERYLKMVVDQQVATQQEMFPQTFELSPEKSQLLGELLPHVNDLGFNIESFGKNTFIIKGIPAAMPEQESITELIHQVVDSYSSNLDIQLGINENLARSFAVYSSVKRRKELSQEDMQQLIDELFACENPYTSPGGKKCFITYELDDLQKSFA